MPQFRWSCSYRSLSTLSKNGSFFAAQGLYHTVWEAKRRRDHRWGRRPSKGRWLLAEKEDSCVTAVFVTQRSLVVYMRAIGDSSDERMYVYVPAFLFLRETKEKHKSRILWCHLQKEETLRVAHFLTKLIWESDSHVPMVVMWDPFVRCLPSTCYGLLLWTR